MKWKKIQRNREKAHMLTTVVSPCHHRENSILELRGLIPMLGDNWAHSLTRLLTTTAVTTVVLKDMSRNCSQLRQ